MLAKEQHDSHGSALRRQYITAPAKQTLNESKHSVKLTKTPVPRREKVVPGIRLSDRWNDADPMIAAVVVRQIHLEMSSVTLPLATTTTGFRLWCSWPCMADTSPSEKPHETSGAELVLSPDIHSYPAI